MNWRKIGKYAGALLFASSAIAFIEGFCCSPSSFAVMLGFNAIAFLVSVAIFTHLVAGQSYRPFAHALAVLLLEEAMGLALWLVLVLMLPDGLVSPLDAQVFFGWLVLGCALAAGTVLGINLQRRARQPAEGCT
ncbi:hypothetical protein [Steroidobacter cummioxidans]|uniref:hypothetical protein n=1 Tax=Steroidobacter cummioxidans TaxID=1803913 RepID=UPI0012905F01|nr:hypothetical protein [Steroidobacter cummioxidans]